MKCDESSSTESVRFRREPLAEWDSLSDPPESTFDARVERRRNGHPEARRSMMNSLKRPDAAARDHRVPRPLMFPIGEPIFVTLPAGAKVHDPILILKGMFDGREDGHDARLER